MLDQFTALRGNWVDLIIIIIILFYLWEGIDRGLILGTIDLASFFLSFLASLKLYGFAAHILISNFAISRGIANAAGFILVGFFTQLIFSIIIGIIYARLPKRLVHTRWDRFFGFIPSIGSGLIFTAFVLTLLISLPIRGNIKAAVLVGKLSGPLVRQTQGVEGDLKKIFGEAVNDTLTFFTVSPQSEERVDLHFTQKDITVSADNEQTMFALVNEERQKNGLHRLSFNNHLRDTARKHARDMFERGYFSHYNPEGKSPFDRMKDDGIFFSAAGENLALAPSVQLAHEGLMNSPGHRANILSADFGKVGIGVIDGGIYGKMFVQEFTD